jgi:hypothetical protein
MIQMERILEVSSGAGLSLTFSEVSFVFGWGSVAFRVGMLEALLLFKLITHENQALPRIRRCQSHCRRR